MRAAIYARYSSESQRQESIEDQIFTCRRLAREKGFTILDDHIYTDYAQSGASKDRIGLNELIAASARANCSTWSLSMIYPDLLEITFLMLSVLAEFQFVGVSVISVADNLDSSDEDSALGIQIRGIFNELQLRDLKKKDPTRARSVRNNAAFSAGERTFGYASYSCPEKPYHRQERPISARRIQTLTVEPREAGVVLSNISNSIVGWTSPSLGIVKLLNQDECIRGRKNQLKRTGRTTTVGRILSNEKYIGKWVWNKSESRRDPKTGRRRQIPQT